MRLTALKPCRTFTAAALLLGAAIANFGQGIRSSSGAKVAASFGFNGIDPSGKMDAKMLATAPRASDMAKAKQLTAMVPTPATLAEFVKDGRLNSGPMQQQAKPAAVPDAADTSTPWTAEEEQSIGEAGAAKMSAMFGLENDEKATRYVNLVGSTVAQFASRPITYRFAILNTEIAGSFALPGGYIFITRASIFNMRNEAQLAGVLGHDIVHVAERHLEKEIRGDLAKLRADELRGLFTTSLSRDEEDAADEQGTLLAAKAGYAASGLKDFLELLKNLDEKPENYQMFGQLLATHPSFDARINRLQPLVETYGGGGQTLEARFETNFQ